MTVLRDQSQSDLYKIRDIQALTQGAKNAAQAFRFVIEVEGIISAYFTEIRGLGMERDIKEYTEGGTNDFVYKFPGRTKWTNITLSRGITTDHFLWDWYSAGLYDGKVKRKNLTILLANTNMLEEKRWYVYEAFPAKWSGADLATDSLQVALETIEIAHHGLTLDTSNSGKPIAPGTFADVPGRSGMTNWNDFKATAI